MRCKVIFLMELLPQSVNYIYGFKEVCFFVQRSPLQVQISIRGWIRFRPLSHVLLNQIPIRCFWNATVWTGARGRESQTNTMVTRSWNQPENLDEKPSSSRFHHSELQLRIHTLLCTEVVQRARTAVCTFSFSSSFSDSTFASITGCFHRTATQQWNNVHSHFCPPCPCWLLYTESSIWSQIWATVRSKLSATTCSLSAAVESEDNRITSVSADSFKPPRHLITVSIVIK